MDDFEHLRADAGLSMLAVWAEMDAELADEFRDGNVPAQLAPLTVAKAAFAALPNTVTSYYYALESLRI